MESDEDDIFEFDDKVKVENTNQINLDANNFKIPISETDTVVVIKDFNTAQKLSIDDFNILSVLGKGAYGQVFLVKKKTAERVYAMKVLKKASIVLHDYEQSTKNERYIVWFIWSILEAINHPFIVRLHYAFQCPARLYLILEFCAGGELFSYLATERMFSDKTAKFYICELLLALEHLHSLGIIYRDLKPENVMLDRDGHLVLTDFGLSKVAIDAQTVCGTLEFTAPEIFEERVYNRTVDYWSLGIMLYDMVTGSPPFTGTNRKKIMESVLRKKPFYPAYMAQSTRDLVTKLLKKNPLHRLGSDSIDQIKSHLFFKGVDWKVVFDRQLEVPFKPTLTSIDDINAFSHEFTGMSIPGSLIEKHSFVDINPFLGFSFVAQSAISPASSL